MKKLSQSNKLAILAYVTFIGMLIAYFMNKENKHPFATWHIKNMFGLILILFISLALEDYAVGFYIYCVSVILWLYSLIMVITNQQKAIPVLSEKFQEWFTFLN